MLLHHIKSSLYSRMIFFPVFADSCSILIYKNSLFYQCAFITLEVKVESSRYVSKDWMRV